MMRKTFVLFPNSFYFITLPSVVWSRRVFTCTLVDVYFCVFLSVTGLGELGAAPLNSCLSHLFTELIHSFIHSLHGIDKGLFCESAMPGPMEAAVKSARSPLQGSAVYGQERARVKTDCHRETWGCPAGAGRTRPGRQGRGLPRGEWPGDSPLRGCGEGWTLVCSPWTAGDLGPWGGGRSDRELQRPAGLQRAAGGSRSSTPAGTFRRGRGRSELSGRGNAAQTPDGKLSFSFW